MRTTSTILAMVATLVTVDASQAQDATIQGCVGRGGQLRVVDDGASCKRKEAPLTWAVQGPAGVPGPTGPVCAPGSGAELPACTTQARLTIERFDGGALDAHAFRVGLDFVPPVGGPGSGSGHLTLDPLQITKLVDANSPALFLAATEGRHFPTATLEVFGADGTTPTTTYTFAQVVITSLEQGDRTCGDAPSESIAWAFASVEVVMP
ncbi:MAG TPA: type VI secretion system tube protein Hcp [Candidatus Binatia bacterium]|jgi:hypothetical protein|nr:type VI secretion system tube protein Hcp [Candidatus Binatia bacterium]